MADLYGVMTDKVFFKIAKDSIVAWWNENTYLLDKFGEISVKNVYVTWSCKAIENFKGLFGVNRDGDGLYFEVTYHDKKKQCYLDIYNKEGQIVVPVVFD